MKFFETNSQFHLMKQDEEIPSDLKVYELGLGDYPSEVEVEEYDLKIISWHTYNWPQQAHLALCYKGLWFKTNKVPRSEKSIINLLNELKKGDHEKKIIELIKDGFVNNTNYCINANLNRD